MANTSRINGLTPIRHITGAPWNGQLEVFYHSTANASAIYKGSPVLGATGLAGAGSDPLGVYQTIVVGAASEALLLGVAWSFGTTPQVAAQVNNLNAVNYCPASTGMYIGVITDPTVVFEVQDNGTTLTAADIGKWADISSDAAKGSTTTGRSLASLDQGTLTATGALQLRILRMAYRADNELAANAKWEVVIAEHLDSQGAAGTGYHTT
jgi:hypothetical protein